MSKKHKKRATTQPLRSVRSIREVGMNSYASAPEALEINDGEEFQARDGSNLRTMAEAEAEERREARAEKLHDVTEKRRQNEVAAVQDGGDRSIPQLLWRLLASPFNLAIALVKIPLKVTAQMARGNAS